MNSSILTPPAPRTWVPLFLGGGGQNCFAYSGRCVWIHTHGRGDFFLVHGPPNLWQGSRVRTPGTPGRPPLRALGGGDLAVFTLGKGV